MYVCVNIYVYVNVCMYVCVCFCVCIYLFSPHLPLLLHCWLLPDFGIIKKIALNRGHRFRKKYISTFGNNFLRTGLPFVSENILIRTIFSRSREETFSLSSVLLISLVSLFLP